MHSRRSTGRDMSIERPDVVISQLTYDLIRRQKKVKSELISLNENSDDVFGKDLMSQYGDLESKYLYIPANEIRDENEERINISVPFNMTEIRNYIMSFGNFSFKKYVIAGGSLTSKILNGHQGIEDNPDIDIFFYGLTESQIYNKIDQILQEIINSLPVEYIDKMQFNYTRLPFTYNLTIRNNNTYSTRKYQFVLRTYSSISEILYGFDIPAGAVAFNGTNVYMTPMAYFSLSYKTIIVDTTRRSTTYELRLLKYMDDKGLSLLFPFSRPVDIMDDLTISGVLQEVANMTRDAAYNEYTGTGGYVKINIPNTDISGYLSSTIQYLLLDRPLIIKKVSYPGEIISCKKTPISYINNLPMTWAYQMAYSMCDKFYQYISCHWQLQHFVGTGVHGRINPRTDILKMDRILMQTFHYGGEYRIDELCKAMIDKAFGKHSFLDEPNINVYIRDDDDALIAMDIKYSVICPVRLKLFFSDENSMFMFLKSFIGLYILPDNERKEEQMRLLAIGIIEPLVKKTVMRTHGWKVITDNPGSQLTASINPILEDPRKWYRYLHSSLNPDALFLRFEYNSSLRLVYYLSTNLAKTTDLYPTLIRTILRNIRSPDQFKNNPLYYQILNDISDDGTSFVPSIDYRDLASYTSSGLMFP